MTNPAWLNLTNTTDALSKKYIVCPIHKYNVQIAFWPNLASAANKTPNVWAPFESVPFVDPSLYLILFGIGCTVAKLGPGE